jgi:hypothetical protein
MEDVQIFSLNLREKKKPCPLKINVKLDLIIAVNGKLLL